MSNKLSRRAAIRTTALGAGALTLGAITAAAGPNAEAGAFTKSTLTSMAEYKHSVCKWCYNDISLEVLAEKGKDMGLKSIELLGPKDWPTLQKHGLTCAVGMDSFSNLTEGFNNPANHEKLIKPYMELITKAAASGIPNIICFSGNRKGISDEEGLENCAKGLDQVAKHAEKEGVMLIMELLNSKRDHKDYQCDHTPWGVKLVDKIGSPNFKLLYDIYHMQIMEGDIIATIRQYNDYIAHYHTGGVPGRHEINDSQELYYPAIMKAIAELGFKGFVAQEFIPTYEDKLAALEEGLKICTV